MKLYDVTVTRTGSITVLANSEKGAMSVVETMYASYIDKHGSLDFWEPTDAKEHTITLRDFLWELGFDYEVNDDKTISLIDTREVNLDDIEALRFNNVEDIICSLNRYIEDDQPEGIDYSLIACGVPRTVIHKLDLKEKIALAENLKIKVPEYYYAILNPEMIKIVEFDL